MKKKNLVYLLGAIVLTGSLIAGVVYAAFSFKAKILGSTFSTGSAKLAFMEHLPMGTDPDNLVDQLPGPNFENIESGWTEDYLLKLVNKGTSKVSITTTANYETVNDPKDLRNDIKVEVIRWDDTNQNGELDSGEESQILGKKTIIKWKTEGFDLGELNYGQVMPLILRFSADHITESKQGVVAVFDFEFNSIQM